jgi:hypothetical protein
MGLLYCDSICMPIVYVRLLPEGPAVVSETFSAFCSVLPLNTTLTVLHHPRDSSVAEHIKQEFTS